MRTIVKNILQVPNEKLNEKYLGMIADVGVSKKGSFKYLKDRLCQKNQGWIEKTLSAARKDVLVKSIAQAIPVFSISRFKILKGFCKHLTSMIRSFWWG